MSVSKEKRLERAQMHVLLSMPFFAAGMMKLPVVWDKSISTACTDGINMKINPEWAEALPDPVLSTIICHEVAHCLLGHHWRAPDGADWQTWNEATDHAVNLMLKQFSGVVMKTGLADPLPFPEPADAYHANPAFAEMSEEQIYNILANRKQQGGNPGGKSGNGPSGDSNGAGIVERAPGKSRNKPEKGQQKPVQQPQPKQGQGQQPAPHSMPKFGDFEKPPGDSATQGKIKTEWEKTAIDSVKLSKGQGIVPGGMERFVNELIHPQVSWQELLRSWLREQCNDDWNFLEPAMEYDESGFILPSLKSDKVGTLVFATDTSGSINDELLAQFQGEKQKALDDMRPTKLIDIYCDSRIHAVREYATGDTIAMDAPGGGGTNFRPVFQHVETLDKQPKALVYLTDLQGDFPDEPPPYPVIWVTWAKGGTAPFGEVVYVEL